MAIISPVAKQQFFGLDGLPLAGGKVYTWIAGSTTPKQTFTDASGATPATNPIILDAYGMASIWLGQGSYKFSVHNSADVQIYPDIDNVSGDAQYIAGSVLGVTQSPGDNSTKLATTAFVQNAVSSGLIQAGFCTPWFIDTLPSGGWLWCDGRAYLRALYPTLSAHLIQNPLYVGDGVTTFVMPDLRDYALVGKGTMGGTAAAGRVTIAGSGIDTSVVGHVGGAEVVALTAAQNGTHTHTVTDPGHTHTYNTVAFAPSFTAGGGSSVSTTPVTNTGSNTTGITIANSGTGANHTNMQPTIVCNWIMKT